ncbi:hypothetical protein ACV35Z_33425, partial [Pseudomonas aeruginosa]
CASGEPKLAGASIRKRLTGALAHKGRSFIGRVLKGWNRFVGQTGTQVLKGLELGSPYSWQLAERDLFGAVPCLRAEQVALGELPGVRRAPLQSLQHLGAGTPDGAGPACQHATEAGAS